MRLRIAEHAILTVPKELVPRPEEVSKEPVKRNAGEIVQVVGRRSLGLTSLSSLGALPFFFIAQDMLLATISTAVFLGTAARVITAEKYGVSDFFPGKESSKVEVEEVPFESISISPYKNWDNAFLPYAGEVINIDYRHSVQPPKGVLLGGESMNFFTIWMDRTDAPSKKQILKNFYGEVARKSHFWSIEHCRKAVRFYAE